LRKLPARRKKKKKRKEKKERVQDLKKETPYFRRLFPTKLGKTAAKQEKGKKKKKKTGQESSWSKPRLKNTNKQALFPWGKLKKSPTKQQKRGSEAKGKNASVTPTGKWPWGERTTWAGVERRSARTLLERCFH